MPIILPVTSTPLYKQIVAQLATDTDPTQGLLAALGEGVNSIFPNYTTDGPSADRAKCPTPFLIVAPYGKRALDKQGREIRTIVEIHDDEDQGEQRWPGILARLHYLLTVSEWRPKDDGSHRYVTGIYFDSESPPDLPDTRYATNMIQVVYSCKAMDRTSSHGYNG